jgi:cytochrome c-type biogenesis protein CcmH
MSFMTMIRGASVSLLVFLSGLALAAEDKFHFDDPVNHSLFVELTKSLRCPKCQNQNLAGSDAMIANDLKRKVYQLVQEGQSSQQIIDYMKQRYGDFVYYQPPVNPMTVWLWLLPLLLIGGGIILVVLSRQRQVPAADEGQLAQADKLLEGDE